jgi:Uma2 family endonuclease
MLTRTPDAARTDRTFVAEPPEHDAVVVLSDVPWTVYEALLKSRRDAPVPRFAFVNGHMEIMSPGRAHVRTKTNLARLIEAFGMFRDVPLTGMGSWTLKSRLLKKGVEPDECYFVGRSDGEAPDLALEVVMASDALDKLPIYAALGVREVWIWRSGALTVHALDGEGYTQVGRSTLLPDLDLTMLTMLAPQTDQHAAIQTWMRWLRAGA